MAIGLIFQGTGVTPEQYQQVLDQVCPDNHPPPGMLYHAAGLGEDGMIVVDVFQSPEALQRFEEQLAPGAATGQHHGPPGDDLPHHQYHAVLGPQPSQEAAAAPRVMPRAMR